MKTLIALMLFVAGTTMSLYAQDGGRAYISEDLWNTRAPYEQPKADKVGPLHNPPLIPMPQFVTNFINPALYNLAEVMLPMKYDYRPYQPVQGTRRNISATLPRTKKR